MKVSVVVPIYNAEKFIEATVEMLCKQTLSDIEIILVNDGSSDSSGEICDKLSKQDSRIKVIHLKNSGVCVARNTGVKVAQGEYITFCDSDDVISEKLVEVLYKLATENNCDMASVKYSFKFPDGKIKKAESTGKFKKYDNNCEAIKDFLEGKIFSGVYTKIFHRELAAKITFEEGKKINEDRMYVFDALRNAKAICYKDECLYRYIRREISSSNGSFNEKFFDCVYFAKKIEKIVEKDFPQIINFAKANSMHTYFYMLKMMCKYNVEKEYRDSFDEYVKILRSVSVSFAKKYFSKKDLIKWSALKINKGLFKFVINKFGRT